MTERQVGKARIYLAYNPTSLFIMEEIQERNSNRAGSWRQELMQRPWRVLLTNLLPMACSACFIKEPRINQPRDGTTYNGLGPPPPTTD